MPWNWRIGNKKDMIKKLRKQFIMVTMLSMFLVLVVIIGTMNIVGYRKVITKTDSVLDMLVENDAHFPERILGDRFLKDYWGHKDISPETPFETRFFSVLISPVGLIVTVDTGRIAAIQSDEAIEIAQKVYEKGKSKGFYGNYRYRVSGSEDYLLLIFVDATRELAAFRSQLETSLLVSAAGLLAVFILVVLFSKKVFKPVAESYEKQKRFITDASHELKTPLTIISANMEVLDMEQGENEWSESVKKQVQRMSGLVNQMVTLSRMDETAKMEKKEFSLSNAVREIADSYYPVAGQKSKKFQTDIAENISYVGDEKLIRQMLGLLLDNAMEYSIEEGEIRLSLKTKGRHAELLLWNQADNLDKGNQDILFERFYRPDKSRSTKTGGSGIGLSIVKSIVELHKGSVSAVSEDGKSITFRILL